MNKQRKKEDIQKMNKQRKKEDRQKENKHRKKRKMKSDISGMEFDLSSPFPPTLEQVNLCGHILSNSVAALFSQQSPPAEISYSVLVVEQLKVYITPIIEHTMYCFNQECCFKLSGDVNFAKGSANKALNTLDKLLLFNNHYQLMSDFEIWDIQNPPCLLELKKLASRHPYQPQSSLLRNEIANHKEEIHERMSSIILYRENNPQWEIGNKAKVVVDPQCISRPKRYDYPAEEKYLNLENFNLFNVVGGTSYKEFDCRKYRVTNNEVSAFFINKNAKFSKIFRKGTKHPFLLPHNFKDDAIRNYYMVKYHAFLHGRRGSEEVDNWEDYFFGGKRWKKAGAPDFNEEHLRQQRLENQYLSGRTRVTEVLEGEISEEIVDSGFDVESDSSTCLNDCFEEEFLGKFRADIKRGRKSSKDRRDTCIMEWEVRMSTLNLVDQICK